jgi:hypothetical protein
MCTYHWSPINQSLRSFIFVHAVCLPLWPCDIYHLSFLLHAVSISITLIIFQFSAGHYHALSTRFCRFVMSTVTRVTLGAHALLCCLETCTSFLLSILVSRFRAYTGPRFPNSAVFSKHLGTTCSVCCRCSGLYFGDHDLSPFV